MFRGKTQNRVSTIACGWQAEAQMYSHVQASHVSMCSLCSYGCMYARIRVCFYSTIAFHMKSRFLSIRLNAQEMLSTSIGPTRRDFRREELH